MDSGRPLTGLIISLVHQCRLRNLHRMKDEMSLIIFSQHN